MIQLFSCRCEPRVRSIRHVKSQVQRLPSKAVSQSHVCSNLIWNTNLKRKVQLPSRQKNEMSSTSESSLLCKTHFLFSSQTWNPEDKILESYAPESICQSQISKDLQHSSRRLTRRSGHGRSWHRPHRRRRAIEISRWKRWWKSIRREWCSNCQSAHSQVLSECPWWCHTWRWHWLHRIPCHTATTGCWCCSNLSPPLCHLLVTFHLRASMLLFRPRMLKHPLGL